MSRAFRAIATLATGGLGVGIGYWNSVSPYIVRRELPDDYFNGMCMGFGGLVGLVLGGYCAELGRSKLIWGISFGLTVTVAAAIPYVFLNSTENHSREAVAFFCPVAFLLIQALRRH